MRDAKAIECTQVRIFPSDALPADRITVPAVAVLLRDRFGWIPGETDIPGEIALDGGFYPSKEDKDATVVRRIRINPRRIVLSVTGDSDAAERVYGGLIDAFAEVTGRQGWHAEPVALVEETTCTVTMDFDWSALLAPQLVAFCHKALGNLSSPLASARIKGLALSLKLGFDPTGGDVSAHGITLNDKILTIEPRADTPLEERKFFSHAPTNSSTHLLLLRELETTILAGRCQAPPTASPKPGPRRAARRS